MSKKNAAAAGRNFGARLSPAAIVEAVKNHPIVRAIEEHAADERHAARMEIGAELEQLGVERAKTLGMLEAAANSAEKALAEILPDYNRRLVAVVEAQSEYTLSYRRFDSDISRRETQLRNSAPAIIDEYISRLSEMFEETRLNYAGVEGSRQVRRAGEVIGVTIVTDRPSLERRLQAIRAAIGIAENFKDEPDQRNIAERLRALVDGLPELIVEEKEIRIQAPMVNVREL